VADNNFDLIVIGAGPGGYVAAIRGAQLGMKVACVEVAEGAGGLGGVCNNTGCIPTKAMLESAGYAKKIGGFAEYGITTGEVKLDIGVAAKRAKKVAEAGAKGVGFLFKKNKIESITGWGRLAGGNKVEVEGKEGKRTITGKNIIIATGSRPRSLPMLKIDGDRVWSSDQAVFPNKLPASLGIIGAGAIGMEFADVYNAFGTKVTVIEALPQILPLEDKDCAGVVEKSYKKRGIDLLVGAKLEKADIGKNGVTLTMAAKEGKAQTLEVERVLVAVGRAPIIDDIGLDKAGVKTDKGAIVVDDHLQTSAKNIYAIGDVGRAPLLAHKASHEGIAVVEHIAGVGHGMVDYNNIPSVTYCHPEVASVGLTEAAAREKKLDIEVGTFPWSANGRARTAGESEGFVKIIRDKKYSEIVGAHIVGPHASELIAEFVIGRHLESTVEEMEKAMHPHPTLSEAVAEAALAAVGRVIHM
jgi:dihydrolipoamide dehydrogenase